MVKGAARSRMCLLMTEFSEKWRREDPAAWGLCSTWNNDLDERIRPEIPSSLRWDLPEYLYSYISGLIIQVIHHSAKQGRR